MTPQKSEACRKEIEMLMEYNMFERSKSPWACGVVMAKKKGVTQVLLSFPLLQRSDGKGRVPDSPH